MTGNKSNKYILFSNLNLMKTNNLWKNLSSKYDVKILEMHEIFDGYLKYNESELINVYFFQKFDEIFFKKNKLELFFKPLIKRLKVSHKKTYLLCCW